MLPSQVIVTLFIYLAHIAGFISGYTTPINRVYCPLPAGDTAPSHCRFHKVTGTLAATAAGDADPTGRGSFAIDAKLKRTIEEYLSLREKSSGQRDAETEQSLELERIRSSNQASTGSPWGIFQPTGWFREKSQFELQAQVDTRIPINPHPLSFYELSKYGYERLAEQIMTLGGPTVVGAAMGIDWKDTQFDKIQWDESKRPVRETFSSLDTKGSLSLGGSLEDRLQLAADIDVEAVKERLQLQRELQLELEAEQDDNGNNLGRGDRVRLDPFDTISYGGDGSAGSRRSRQRASAIQVSTPNGERFALKGPERVFLVVLVATASLAHGHASRDVLALHEQFTGVAMDASVYGSYASVAAAVTSAVVAASKAVELKRNPLLWAAMGVLGGPSVSLRLKSMPPLP